MNPPRDFTDVPKLYNEYLFFVDGNKDRIHTAIPVRIISIEEAKNHKFLVDGDSLCNIWKQNLEDCKNKSIFSHDENGYWCYAPYTDCFVVCAISTYSENLVYFSRHINRQWYSLEIEETWQGGMLYCK